MTLYLSAGSLIQGTTMTKEMHSNRFHSDLVIVLGKSES